MGPKVDQKLNGRKPVPLDPVAQKMLDDFVASGRPNAHLLPGRAGAGQLRGAVRGPAAGRGRGRDGRPRDPRRGRHDPGALVPARPTSEGLGLVVYFHGGGWLLGSHESHDTICRSLANASGAVVLNVGYRLAPERKFPTAVDDAWAATHVGRGARRRARRRRRAAMAVAGDSAGGNLAAVRGPAGARRGRPGAAVPAAHLPGHGRRHRRRLRHGVRGLLPLPRRDPVALRALLRVARQRPRPARLAAATATPHGLPPAQIQSAECDPLHPQAELYRDHLRAAGVRRRLPRRTTG